MIAPVALRPKTSIVTLDMIRDFDEKGYFILPQVVDKETLDQLKWCLEQEIVELHKQMDLLQVDHIGITHRDKRYFINDTHKKHQVMYEFAFGALMHEICRATIGLNVWLFFEQFVVKAAKANDGKPGMSFAWHQDSGYIPHARPFYLSCWTALDDMTEENGTIRVLPYSRGGGKQPVSHFRMDKTNDMVGYQGQDKGELVSVPAGSVVVFSSFTLHCSGENFTNKPRRSYLTQYSLAPIYNEKGDGFHAIAAPFLKNGDDAFLAWSDFQKQ